MSDEFRIATLPINWHFMNGLTYPTYINIINKNGEKIKQYVKDYNEHHAIIRNRFARNGRDQSIVL